MASSSPHTYSSRPSGYLIQSDGIDMPRAKGLIEYMMGLNFLDMSPSERDAIIDALTPEQIGYILQFFPEQYDHSHEEILFLCIYAHISNNTRKRYEDIMKNLYYKQANDPIYKKNWEKKEAMRGDKRAMDYYL